MKHAFISSGKFMNPKRYLVITCYNGISQSWLNILQYDWKFYSPNANEQAKSMISQIHREKTPNYMQ